MAPAAVLALLLAAPAAAFPDCARAGKPPKDRPFLQDVLDCQERERAKLRETRRRAGREPSAAELDALDSHQREEVRAYIARNQSAEAVAEAPPEPAEPTRPRGAAKGGKLGGLADKDLERATPEQAKGLEDLQRRLHEQAGDGSRGISPAMAKDIEETLLRRQGHVSPEMAELLKAVSKDGGTLSHDTMRRLSDAAKAAKAEGIDLGVDKKTEEGLLNFTPPAETGAPAPSASPGSL